MQLGTLVHQATAVSTAVLCLKFYAAIMVQGGKRFKAGSRPPEDAAMSIAKGVPQNFIGSPREDDPKVKKAKEDDRRWTRIIQNDLENIPLGLIVSWASVLSAKSSTAHLTFCAMFTLGRIGHTIAYAKGLQPHRALFWLAAVLGVLGMAVNAMLGAF
ncbi:hypothetical protein CYMTET_47850 [Cymbomonas tetramitiformis]|uniref:Microsomal glutathione S-transferase 1 n=1 Tax=Cymbomonas tetramitiformis TaxID=36881 RepID=A0AAE0BTE4_9CHLO|nr:hypothetical protein CYMTET_47850 [Cymbomonas tetramitiformis]